MSQAPLCPSDPVAWTSPDRPAPAPWMWPAIAAVVFVPFVLTTLGLAVVALRPRPPVETAALPEVAPPAVPEPVPAGVESVPTAPEPVDPGEARPPIPGPRPAVTDPEPEPAAAAAASPPKCDRFGTAIDFVRSPALAFRHAAREEKLVMVLHIAGHFDDPGFT